MMNPSGRLGLQAFGLACIIFLMLFRIWIHHRSNRVKGTCFYVYEACMWASFFLNVFMHSFDIWSSHLEIRLGPHASEAQFNKLLDEKYLKLYFFAGLAYSCFLWLAKGSFLALYYEMYESLGRGIQITLHAVAVFSGTTFLVNILLKFSWCRPLSTNWSTGPHRCTSNQSLPVSSTTAIFNIACDLGLLILFGLILSTLSLRNRDRLAASFIGIVGLCTIISASVRYALVFAGLSNVSWQTLRTVQLWTCIEMGLVMLALTLPAFRVFLRREYFRPRPKAGPQGSSEQETIGSKGRVKKIMTTETELSLFTRDEDRVALYDSTPEGNRA